MNVSANGSFSATARTPVSGETVVTTPTVSFVVAKGYGELSYHFELTIQSSSPYLAVDGAGSAAIKYQYWTPVSWSSWKSAGVGISLKTDPFKACGYTTVLGYDVGGCVP
jgi:hypothetical protein